MRVTSRVDENGRREASRRGGHEFIPVLMLDAVPYYGVGPAKSRSVIVHAAGSGQRPTGAGQPIGFQRRGPGAPNSPKTRIAPRTRTPVFGLAQLCGRQWERGDRVRCCIWTLTC